MQNPIDAGQRISRAAYRCLHIAEIGSALDCSIALRSHDKWSGLEIQTQF
jgi:hypothetical protein